MQWTIAKVWIAIIAGGLAIIGLTWLAWYAYSTNAEDKQRNLCKARGGVPVRSVHERNAITCIDPKSVAPLR